MRLMAGVVGLVVVAFFCKPAHCYFDDLSSLQPICIANDIYTI